MSPLEPNARTEDFLTLGIETSCDDTGVALLRGERTKIGRAHV